MPSYQIDRHQLDQISRSQSPQARPEPFAVSKGRMKFGRERLNSSTLATIAQDTETLESIVKVQKRSALHNKATLRFLHNCHRRHAEVKAQYLYTPEQLQDELRIRRVFKVIDADGSNALDLDEMVEIFKKYNFDVKKQQIEQLYAYVDKTNDKVLDFDEFKACATSHETNALFSRIMNELSEKQRQAEEAQLQQPIVYMPRTVQSMIEYLSFLIKREQKLDAIRGGTGDTDNSTTIVPGRERVLLSFDGLRNRVDKIRELISLNDLEESHDNPYRRQFKARTLQQIEEQREAKRFQRKRKLDPYTAAKADFEAGLAGAFAQDLHSVQNVRRLRELLEQQEKPSRSHSARKLQSFLRSAHNSNKVKQSLQMPTEAEEQITHSVQNRARKLTTGSIHRSCFTENSPTPPSAATAAVGGGATAQRGERTAIAHLLQLQEDQQRRLKGTDLQTPQALQQLVSAAKQQLVSAAKQQLSRLNSSKRIRVVEDNSLVQGHSKGTVPTTIPTSSLAGVLSNSTLPSHAPYLRASERSVTRRGGGNIEATYSISSGYDNHIPATAAVNAVGKSLNSKSYISSTSATGNAAQSLITEGSSTHRARARLLYSLHSELGDKKGPINPRAERKVRAYSYLEAPPILAVKGTASSRKVINTPFFG